jgi:fused signal recognition particle receptor
LDKEFFDDLEDLLIEGDLGVTTTLEIIEEIRGALTRGRKTDQELIALTKEILLRYLRTVRIERQTGIPLLVLVLGVNGVGKTTPIAKLADYFRRVQGMKEIFLAAADTFRAAAIDQLAIHGERLGLKVISQRPGADPGAVIYDTIESACAKKADMILADTAGRMHTKANLVKELQKIDKIIRARIPSYHSLLVIDSTTGQNGSGRPRPSTRPFTSTPSFCRSSIRPRRGVSRSRSSGASGFRFRSSEPERSSATSRRSIQQPSWTTCWHHDEAPSSHRLSVFRGTLPPWGEHLPIQSHGFRRSNRSIESEWTNSPIP